MRRIVVLLVVLLSIVTFTWAVDETPTATPTATATPTRTFTPTPTSTNTPTPSTATLYIGDISVMGVPVGVVPAVFTVTLFSRSSNTITVHWTTVDNTATAPADYIVSSGNLTFLPGHVINTIVVYVKGHTVTNPVSFYVNLSNAVNAPIARSGGTCTITPYVGVPTRTATPTATYTPTPVIKYTGSIDVPDFSDPNNPCIMTFANGALITTTCPTPTP